METKFDFTPIHIVRGLQALLAILTLGLLAHVAQFFNSNSNSSANHVPNGIAFAIFTSVLTLLITLPYVLLTPRFFPHLFKSHTKHTILILESLSMVLWFASFVSVAAFLGKLSVCRGDVCHAAKAGGVVAALAWLSWGVTSLFALRFCLGMGVGAPEKIGKGERKRERLVRVLRLHSVWTGREGRGEVQRGDDVGAGAAWPRDDWRVNARGDNMI